MATTALVLTVEKAQLDVKQSAGIERFREPVTGSGSVGTQTWIELLVLQSRNSCYFGDVEYSVHDSEGKVSHCRIYELLIFLYLDKFLDRVFGSFPLTVFVLCFQLKIVVVLRCVFECTSTRCSKTSLEESWQCKRF